jgi:hypothetical protein
MAHREFRTADGRLWNVWSVHPEYAERRSMAAPSREQPTKERRVRAEVRATLAGSYSRGWLVFETKGEKRRLTPYPENWVDMSDAELGTLLTSASKVAHVRRRLVE